jgi:ABC-type uncharacterized transport system substrate-binding protein
MLKAKRLLLMFLFIFSGFVMLPVQAKTILVIQSYHNENAWDISYKKGLEEVLGREHDLVYFEMDTKRLPESEFNMRAAQAWQAYRALQPDLVILGDDNALKYLGAKFKDTETPVVYLGINANPRKYGVTRAVNITGVIERPLLRRSILMLKKMLPLKRALVLLDSKETSRVIKEDIFHGQGSMNLAGIKIDIRLISTFEEWQKQVKRARERKYDVLVAGLYHTLVDRNGEHVDPEHVITWTSANSQVPPFGFWDFSVGADKNIGGYVIFGYEEGRLAGEIAQDVLAGDKRHVRSETGGQGRFMFSKKQLDKWGIELPEEIRRPATFVD